MSFIELQHDSELIAKGGRTLRGDVVIWCNGQGFEPTCVVVSRFVRRENPIYGSNFKNVYNLGLYFDNDAQAMNFKIRWM